MTFPIPKNEKARVELLQSLDILDSLTEENYDNIAKMAADIFDMPISLISLVDKERQWFKAKIGLETAEIERDYAFCAHTIMDDTVMVIEDTYEDERFQSNPLVTGDPFIRFYAGAPIIVSDGLKVGVVCVIDQKPRKITEKQKRLLEFLANEVSNLLKIRKITLELQGNQKKLEKLEQLIPMCAWCKNIKNNEDYWTKVEDYLKTLTKKEVTHAICPSAQMILINPTVKLSHKCSFFTTFLDFFFSIEFSTFQYIEINVY